MGSSESDPDAFLRPLDTWIQQQKDEIYDSNITNHPNGNSSHLEKYRNALEGLAYKLTRAIDNEDSTTLLALGWPQALVDSIRDMNMRTDILDRIECWFVRYPFVKSRIHLEELRNENAGLQ